MLKINELNNWRDGINQVLLGDCLELMRKMEDKSVDLVLTDPPYGIGADKGSNFYGHTGGKYYEDDWDSQIPIKEVFTEILRIGKKIVIWGGQFMTECLPTNGHWLVWDKKGDIVFDNPFGDCELAWTNINRKSVKKYKCIQQGFIAEERERFHPTQKPVKLFSQILQDYSEENNLIFDPFMGSGTTARACMDLRRDFIGAELSEKYCKVWENRLKQQVLL